MSENRTKAEIIIRDLFQKIKELHLNGRMSYVQHLKEGISDYIEGELYGYDGGCGYDKEYNFFLHGEQSHILIRCKVDEQYPTQRFLQEQMGKFVLNYAGILNANLVYSIPKDQTPEEIIKQCQSIINKLDELIDLKKNHKCHISYVPICDNCLQSPDFSQYKLSPKWLETKNLYIKQ